MTEVSPSAGFEEQLRRSVAVPGPSADFVQRLRGRLDEAVQMRPAPGATRRIRPAWVVLALLVLALATSLAVVGPARALEAVRRLFGFIPGIGFVDQQTSLRVLEEPATQVREGVTLSVTEAVADSSQTVIVYQVDGLSIDAANANGEAPANLGSQEVLRLPDGTAMPIRSADGTGWGSGYRMRLVFEPLPPDVDRATLEIDVLMDMPPGAAPENWSLPLRFVPAPPSFTMAPVLDLGPTPPLTHAGEAPTEASVSDTPYGIELHLDRVVELDDGYILVGSLTWDGSRLSEDAVPTPDLIRLTDGKGDVVPLQPAGPEALPEEHMPYRSDWAFKTSTRSLTGLVTLTLDAVQVSMPADAGFTFDTGPQPRLGQHWTANQTIEVGEHVVTLTDVELQTSHGNPGYRFTFTSDSDVLGVAVEDATHAVGGGFGGGTSGVFSAGVFYPGDPPSGILEMRIIGIDVLLHGPWQITWQPPEVAEVAPSTPVPEVCLTESGWANLLAGSDGTPPANMSGRLLLYDTTAPQGSPNLVLADLDGADQTRLGWGVWPSISPNGRSAAFAGPDGLYVVDLETLQTSRIPGTNENDYHPLWSPDSESIAFVRGAGAFDLFVVRPDGSGLRRVTSTPAYEELGGWIGDSILYASPDADGLHMRIVDPIDGRVTDLFTLDQTKYLGPSVSPDGSRLSFRGAGTGWNPGLYVSNLDGSGRKLVVDPNELAVGSAVWNPDGRWLATSITDPSRTGTTPVLIQPDTCQVVPLTGLIGDVGGWGPGIDDGR